MTKVLLLCPTGRDRRELAVERDDLGPPFVAWLREFCARSLAQPAQRTDEHTDPQGETA